MFLLILLLTLPPGFLSTHEAADSGVPAAAAGVAAPQHLESAGSEPVPNARKQGNRKEKRRQDRKAERKERRERHRRGQNSEQARLEALVESAPPRIPALA